MEIPFSKITLEDRGIIDYYLKKKEYRSCELVFANLFLWSRFFPTEYAIIEETLVFQSIREGGDVSITFPAGDRVSVRKAMDRMIKHFEANNLPVFMHLVQAPEFELLNQWYPQRFEIEYSRDLADYVYETEKLTTLAGKKLHGKRNHINRFRELYPNWSYERLSRDNVEECFQMGLQWRTEHECEYDPERRAEMCVSLNALRLFEELSLIGGVLKVNGEVVAFTIGEPLNSEMFVVHIEKAFPNVQGAYPMINQQFVTNELQAYRYINREEDTGAEGLRKAKLSYRPVFLLEKGKVSEIIR
jgi:hypothetical protein